MQRFVKILFALVFLLLAANIAFWAIATIRSNNKSKQDIAKIPQRSNNSQFQIPTPTINPTQFLSDEQLAQISDAFKKQQYGLVTSAVFTFEYIGKINEINSQGGIERFDNYDHPVDYNYALKIVLESDTGVTERFLYDTRDMTGAIITQKNNGQDKLIDVSELHVGDRIKLRISRDMTKNYLQGNVVELKIVKNP